MADLLVSALATTILGTLNSASLQEIGLLWGFKDDLVKLKSTFNTLQLVLQDAEIKQRKNPPLQDWLRKLKDAAYEADNILDEIAYEDLRRRVESERGKSILYLKNPLIRLQMARRVKNIRKKIDAIAEEGHKFRLGEGVLENRFGVTTEDRQTCSLPVDETEFYGRTVEKERIIKELLDNGRDEDDLSVYAIWGMPGIGKTTLAQKVYNDERAERRFELRIWVCVSEDFGIERLLRAIIHCIDPRDCNISGLEPLQHHLREKLKGKRFLLVLDDVWNEKHRLWDRLKEVLRCNSKGSVLVVTTRSKIVASMMATIKLLQIGCLSEEDSWSLFKQRAFSSGEVAENLAAIGKEMVKKCGGVPLAIKALGSLMRSKCDEREWLSVMENENWHLLDDENGVLPILRLSYDNLPVQMRQCFAYCSLFPKDYEMEVDELIQLWMANGFVVLTDGQTDLPLAGHLIFKELVCRSFFQDVTKYECWDMSTGYTIQRTCKMHDLMHDLAESVMGHETRIVERGGELKIPMHGYCSVEAVVRNKSEIKFPTDGSLRSLIVEDELDQEIKGFSSLLSKQQYLRALHLKGRITHNLPNFPNFVWKLKHLRYLRMSCEGMRSLPESVTHLCNLQTLKLMRSYNLVELPKDLRVMKNLWFLEIEETWRLRCTPPGLRDLTHLRGLSIFIVGEEASQQIEQLKELNLGGKLTLRGLENVRNLEDARSANLIRKRDLTCLELIWPTDITNDSADHYEEVLQGLQPHQNLEYIRICGYPGSGLPNWVTPLDLKNLRVLVLEDCVKIEHLPLMGNLPCLAEVSLKGMDSVKRLGAEWHGDREDSFPALIQLTIEDMPNLEDLSLPDSAESFPRLADLEISGCPKLTKLPILPTGLESLTLSELPIRRVSNLLDNPSSLSSLKDFRLIRCGNLEFVAERFRHLRSLVLLLITDCDGLTSFPANILENLPSLRTLVLGKCKNLRPLSGPLEGATTLEVLHITKLPELQNLPESMQQLTSLRYLRIDGCDGLCTLPDWLGSLHSLTNLFIQCCSNLNSLPDGLNSLRYLGINQCPQLTERCKKPRGEDWHKISHIPWIEINNESEFSECDRSSVTS